MSPVEKGSFLFMANRLHYKSVLQTNLTLRFLSQLKEELQLLTEGFF